jgi:hypothetical protein
MDRIPEDWNVHSKQQIEVQTRGSNRFEFSIPRRNTPPKR